MAEWIVSPKAQQDLDEIHAYICADNPDAADRVLEAALATFARLAQTPGMGRPKIFAHLSTSQLRSLQVEGFRERLRGSLPGFHKHSHFEMLGS